MVGCFGVSQSGWLVYIYINILNIYIYMLWSIMYILYTYAITCAHGVALNNSKVRIRDGDPYCPFFFRFCVQSR